jgi:sarcosine oxidase delta subunit
MLDQKSEPEIEKRSFICPHCNAFSEQKWYTELIGDKKKKRPVKKATLGG